MLYLFNEHFLSAYYVAVTDLCAGAAVVIKTQSGC